MTTSASHKKILVLIDGSSYLFRAYHALPALSTSDGQPTGAIYGVISMIRKLIKTYLPDYIAVIFDSKEKNFRHALYPAYKANREQMPNELQIQIKPLHDVIKAMGLPLIIQPGIEADDLIGALAKNAEKNGVKTIISTLDKDMAQLVNKHITLINTMTDHTLTIEGVKEKFGVTPDQIIDYLTLIGDTSDNVPGIPKVGPKTAVKWLSEYHSLEKIIQHASSISGKVGESLRQHLQTLPLSKNLVTIRCDTPCNHSLETLKPCAPDVHALKKLFSELEFTSWLKDLATQDESTPHQKSHYFAIQDEKNFFAYLKKLSDANLFALDTETTDVDAMRAELVGLSLCIEPNHAVYIPFMHYDDQKPQLDRDWVLNQLKPILQDSKKTIIGQNLKFDYKILKKYDAVIQIKMQDTMLESYVLNNTSTRHDLDTLALKFLGRKTITFDEVAKKNGKEITFDHVSIQKAVDYAAEDADVTLQIHQVLWEKIQAEKSFQFIIENIEWPLMPILANMEYHGVLIDAEMLKKQSKLLQKRIDHIEERVFLLADEKFNLASPKQLQTILFDKLQLPILKKTPTGAASTAEEVMQELALEYELPKLIVEFRHLSKLKSTYTDALPKQINPHTGRVHTSYNQAVTSTGRLSSNNPNLQNIPARKEAGREIRRAFIAPTGYQIVAADYSQIELRIMAHLSKDPGLLSAFEKGLDIHASTAAEVFGVSLNDVTPIMRRDAKVINFGLLYGMSVFGLAKQLGTTREQAQQYMDKYFTRFSKVHDYMKEACAFANQHGYVETLLGRRLFIPDIHASNHIRRMAAERAAINAPLQGTAADIIKLAMIHIDKEFSTEKLTATMIMQVHDELVFEVEKSQLSITKEIIKNCMENVLPLDVPLLISLGVGDNWDEAH